ncbi:proline iminopeptidase [Ephemerocybe angulata]|uniref:Proline iminopeptidase n=1 Tax=Ephemerocybe angulata TaxID=980116 RepID=A0A8H6HZE3_9AGAR|nr:proline iminopeptidase [Tulosesus angulatus]
MYPPIEPYLSGRLQVSEIHDLYYEISGNKNGSPVVFLHGGPGSGCRESDRSYFNPEKYKIILFDQRGSGRSNPIGSLQDNTTWDLVADIEKLRVELGVEKWHVFGGSWGSTLSLVYAQTHPDRVRSLVVRGIITFRQSERRWIHQEGGTSNLFPEAWDEFVSVIPVEERGDMVKAYHKRIHSEDEGERKAAARAWAKYEMATTKLRPDPEAIELALNNDFASSSLKVKIESHFFVNAGFIKEGQIFAKENLEKIRHIPMIIVNGRYDAVCPPSTAYELKKELPHAELHIVPDAGHSGREEGTAEVLMQAAEKVVDL